MNSYLPQCLAVITADGSGGQSMVLFDQWPVEQNQMEKGRKKEYKLNMINRKE